MKKEFNKLVRDKIPEQITQSGRTVELEYLNDPEKALIAFKNKLNEEVQEFNEAKTPAQLKEELADILEVAYALKHLLSDSPGEVSQIQKKKRHEKGSFKRRIFLKSTEDNNA